MRKYDFKKEDVKLHNILFASTSESDYEMSRVFLLESMPNTKYDELIYVKGYHCSCYGFDDTGWEADICTIDELRKLSLDYGIEEKELKKFIERY